jgi:hypothetical protein
VRLLLLVEGWVSQSLVLVKTHLPTCCSCVCAAAVLRGLSGQQAPTLAGIQQGSSLAIRLNVTCNPSTSVTQHSHACDCGMAEKAHGYSVHCTY